MGEIDSRTLGERIREARKRADLSQEQLGEAVGLDRTAINKIESGIRKVTALELADIARAIGVRMSAFFEEPIPALVAHRSSQGIDTADSRIDALLAAIASEVEFVASLVDWPGILPAEAIERDLVERPETSTAAEELAIAARDMMGLDSAAPVYDLCASVAKLGLLAFSRDIGKDTADAGTILLPQGGVSLVNSHTKVGRRRLALAHELGHYLVGDDYTIDWRVNGQVDPEVPLEARFDRFARALLLPKSSLEHLWTDKVAAWRERGAAIWLASHYRVDMATLAVRLKELGLAGGQSVDAIFKYRTTQSDLIEMDLHVPLPELEGTSVPRRYAQAVIGLVRDEKISRERALDLLHGTVDDADLPDIRVRHPNDIWKFVS
ncbi:XRE family transcriptional regulator [Mycolicibacterium elephantis]